MPIRISSSFLVRDARIFDGTEVIPRGSVLVEEGVIAIVEHDIAPPPGAEVVDGRGSTLLPGLIDAHVHANTQPLPVALEQAVVFGVTTVLDMWCDPAAASELRTLAATRDDVADLRSAGTGATAPGGHPTQHGGGDFPTITEPGEADRFVEARIAEGSDYIKIIVEDGSAFGFSMPTLDQAVVGALVAAAHARGRITLAHVTAQVRAEQAVAAGVDALAHLFVDGPPAPGFAPAVARGGAFVVPTLTVFDPASGAELTEDPRLAPYLTPRWLDWLRFAPPSSPDGPRPSVEHAMTTVRLLREAGVPLLASTDAPNPGTAHGVSIHRELALLVRAGLTPAEALEAATSVSARCFGLSDRGRIAPGLRADLLLVDGDPTVDITATRAIAGVWRGGHRFDREAYRTGIAAGVAAAADGDRS